MAFQKEPHFPGADFQVKHVKLYGLSTVGPKWTEENDDDDVETSFGSHNVGYLEMGVEPSSILIGCSINFGVPIIFGNTQIQ